MTDMQLRRVQAALLTMLVLGAALWAGFERWRKCHDCPPTPALLPGMRIIEATNQPNVYQVYAITNDTNRPDLFKKNPNWSGSH